MHKSYDAIGNEYVIWPEEEKKKLLIAIPSNIGRSVYPVPFVHSLIKLIKNMPDHISFDIKYFGGLRIDAVRNKMARYAIEMGFDYMLFLDDDMIFPDTLISGLLDVLNDPKPKPRYDVVSALYGAKSPYYHYFVMPIETEGHHWLKKVDHEKIYDVKSIATGALLMRVSLFKHLSKPYFLLMMDHNGEIGMTEDCFFGKNCFTNGVRMAVDASLQCQHLKLVPFPKFWKNPWHYYQRPEGEEIISCPPREENRPLNAIPWERDKMIIHPKAGFRKSDGICECIHSRVAMITVNDSEAPHYRCLDCGIITRDRGMIMSEGQKCLIATGADGEILNTGILDNLNLNKENENNND